MEEALQHNNSSAYSSLTNSTTEINEKSMSTTATTRMMMRGSTSPPPPTSSSRMPPKSAAVSTKPSPTSKPGFRSATTTTEAVSEMRHITDDYNALLRRATEEIRVLAADKQDLQDQCEKLMAVNEDLVSDVGKVMRSEAALRRENEEVLAANRELFEETQRLSDEEEKWAGERIRFQEEIRALRDEVGAIEAKVRAVSEREADSREAAARLEGDLKAEAVGREGDAAAARERNSKLEATVMSLRSRVRTLESEKESLARRKEEKAGENLQLMVDADNLAKQGQRRQAEMQAQLQRARDRCGELEKENARFKAQLQNRQQDAPSVAHSAHAPASLGASETKQLERLAEQNKNLTEWREQLIEKNRALAEENAKLKSKCQNLEDLINEEETDIGEVLEVIRKMQQGGSPKSAVGSSPISKFRDIKL